MELLVSLSLDFATKDAAFQIDPKRKPYAALPSTLYHGTARPTFRSFAEAHQGDHDFGWLGSGFYFTTSWDHAKGYAETYRRREKTKISRVVSVSIPAGLRLYELDRKEHSAAFQMSIRKDAVALAHSRALAQQLKNAGFDGACYTHPSGERFVEVMIRDRSKFRVQNEDTPNPSPRAADRDTSPKVTQTQTIPLRAHASAIPIDHATGSMRELTALLRVAYDARPRTKPIQVGDHVMQKFILPKDSIEDLVTALSEEPEFKHRRVGAVTDTFVHSRIKGLSIIVQTTEVTVSMPSPKKKAESVDTDNLLWSMSARAPSPNTRSTAWVLVYVAETGKYLMLKRAKKTNNPNLWNFPGGGIEPGDSPAKGAKRELFEEAGIRASKAELQRIIESMDGTVHYFLLILEKEPRLNIDPKESSKHTWMTMDEIRAKGNKLHRKTAEFVSEKINVRLANMAIRKSGIG